MLAGEGWHPGVIGIVASRIVERHCRPVRADRARRRARAAGRGAASRRSTCTPALAACAAHLGALRRPPRGGRARHRRRRGRRRSGAAFVAHAAAVLSPARPACPVERVDAVVPGATRSGSALAEELERLAPFGHGNPRPTLLVPAARRRAMPRPMGEEGQHARFTRGERRRPRARGRVQDERRAR